MIKYRKQLLLLPLPLHLFPQFRIALVSDASVMQAPVVLQVDLLVPVVLVAHISILESVLLLVNKFGRVLLSVIVHEKHSYPMLEI